MLFNSIEFVLFFLVVTGLYAGLSYWPRMLLLFLASCYFYTALFPQYIFVIFFIIVIDYGVGIWIDREYIHNRKKIILGISLIANIGLLAVFKYYDFFISNIMQGLSIVGFSMGLPLLKLALPVGLSFHIFQSMAYTIEVYKGNVKPERNILIYALYVLFYPQMVAGPIERPTGLLLQLRQNLKPSREDIFYGLQLMSLGFIKKIFIADRLSVYVDAVYLHPANYSSLELLIGTFFFAIQIYCDFSGYVDIARGAARCMGYRLMENFNFPYQATSMSDFWRRWHISLFSWFRDYLYIPLGGNRVGVPVQYRNILIVFLVSGLWHGANWTFVVWGLIHGGYLVIENILNDSVRTLKNFKVPFKKTFIFILVMLSWIFFRASNFSDAMFVLTKVMSMDFLFHRSLQDNLISNWNLLLNFMLCFGLLYGEVLYSSYKQSVTKITWLTLNTVSSKKIVLYASILYVVVMLFSIVYFHASIEGYVGTSKQFIYFQF